VKVCIANLLTDPRHTGGRSASDLATENTNIPLATRVAIRECADPQRETYGSDNEIMAAATSPSSAMATNKS
jgi:hypothetical protein